MSYPGSATTKRRCRRAPTPRARNPRSPPFGAPSAAVRPLAAAHDDGTGATHHGRIASRRHVVHLEHAVAGALAHRQRAALAAAGDVAADGYGRLAVGPGDHGGRGAR